MFLDEHVPQVRAIVRIGQAGKPGDRRAHIELEQLLPDRSVTEKRVLWLGTPTYA